MKQVICTGWSPQGRSLYGERFLEAFDRHWPDDVELQVFVERPHDMPRDACRSLWDVDGANKFEEKWRDVPAANGRKPDDRWKDNEKRTGYSFRWDAYKFFKQILIPDHVAKNMEKGDILVWLDGDTVTLRDVPPDFVPKLLGSADVAYLNRPKKHSEIGFWAVRINNRTRRFVRLAADIYRTEAFLELPEWHSAYVWDHARRASNLSERHLVDPPQKGHVFPHSPLAKYLRHDKGNRKGRER